MLFIDKNSAVDKEALRIYVVEELTKLSQVAEQMLFAEENRQFWNDLHHKIVTIKSKDKKEKLMAVEEQVRELKVFLDTWIKTAVESPERLEFFIQTKANEIKSGDMQKDYFWALQIRHDQLVGLVQVATIMVDKIKEWLTIESGKVLEDPVFWGLTKYSIETQVFLEAKKIHEQRSKLT